MNIIVIGGGAAGLMAAGTAAENGAQVTLLETNEKVGRKLFITGKGRCNVCNNCDTQGVLQNVPVNPRFLYSALGCFSPADVMAFFESRGVPLKTERGNRVFPVSDKSADIIDALFTWIKHTGVKIVHETAEELELADGRVTGVRAGGRVWTADRVIVATGGVSYPQTGSTGDGYRFAKQAGHAIVPPNGSLVPLVTPGGCEALMGLSLRNVQVTVFENNKKIWSDFGEMLFTHFGLSGPLILSASAHMRHFGSKGYHIEIDLKPALDRGGFHLTFDANHSSYQRKMIVWLTDAAGKHGYGVAWDSAKPDQAGGSGVVQIVKLDSDTPLDWNNSGKVLAAADSGHPAVSETPARFEFLRNGDKLTVRVDGKPVVTAADPDFKRFDRLYLRGNDSQTVDRIILTP